MGRGGFQKPRQESWMTTTMNTIQQRDPEAMCSEGPTRKDTEGNPMDGQLAWDHLRNKEVLALRNQHRCFNCFAALKQLEEDVARRTGDRDGARVSLGGHVFKYRNGRYTMAYCQSARKAGPPPPLPPA